MNYLCNNCGKNFELSSGQIKRYNLSLKKDLPIKFYCCKECYYQDNPEVCKRISESWNNRSEEQKQLTNEKKSEIVTDIWKNRTKEEKEKITEKFKETWSNKTKEELLEFSKNVSKGHKKYWDNLSQEGKEEFSKNLRLGWKNKPKAEMDELRKIRSINSKKLWAKRTEKERKELSDKISTILKNKTEKEKKEIIERIHLTKKKNHTYGKSKVENLFYDTFLETKHNINRQFVLDKYVFDFEYNNLLIEINGIFYHNYRPFQNNEIHNKEYLEMINKGKTYQGIAHKWKYTDVEKLKFCKENDINYLVIYTPSTNIDFHIIIDDIINNKYEGQNIIFLNEDIIRKELKRKGKIW